MTKKSENVQMELYVVVRWSTVVKINIDRPCFPSYSQVYLAKYFSIYITNLIYKTLLLINKN